MVTLHLPVDAPSRGELKWFLLLVLLVGKVACCLVRETALLDFSVSYLLRSCTARHERAMTVDIVLVVF